MYKRRKSQKNIYYAIYILCFILVALIVILNVTPKKTSTNQISPKQTTQTQIQTKPKTTQTEQSKTTTASKTTENIISLTNGLEIPLCPAQNHTEDHEIRKFKNYTICYRESYEQAEWSAYCLSDFQLEKNTDRTNDFRVDPLISTGSADLADYRKSSFDRGHLTPAADMSFDETAMSETFYMSNMTPQNPQFNRGIWKDLEAQVRIWVKQFGKAYVVSGPVLNKKATSYTTIGNNNVTIPEYFYKVILVPVYKDNEDRKSPDDTYSVMAIGFVIPNQNCRESFWNYTKSIDDIEELTNLDFYSLLPDDIEDNIEAFYILDEWK